ncbi:hypothetical protein BU24DRAFT_425890 [Aaosphaeria arxii CBS 175.79]|uniref:MI domain-containing protein n=1 Tax=Aaosphaeria arxii CBS 175.79 TaxID=1450172 RepID=A0A6A5XGS1_9PLEO|nr:uncharacterized protein BU24DRAFT_425890 [Aaosphaeria arxii CBS 175.79]KAF2012059.1 hypothetical protein BU24DRAFT_425890 [Aaosphaeria arxii CBS 175.79]
MRQRQFSGPKLPKELRDKFDPANAGKNGRRNYGSLNRKERRKAEREEQKSQRRQPTGRNASRYSRQEPESEEEDDEADFSEEEAPPPKASSSKTEPSQPSKSILKKSQKEARPEPQKEPSPPPNPKLSRSTRDRLEHEDAEIAALEKKLGIKGKKSKGEFDDGLEDLFGDLGDFDSGDELDALRPSKRKRDSGDDDWLAQKRQKALGKAPESSDEEEGFDDDDDDDDFGSDDELEDLDGEDGESGSEQDEDDEGSFEDFGSDDDALEEEPEAPKPRVRENPYVAPVVTASQQPAKYIPPALRGAPSSDAEALARLKRQIQGLLNRLSEANILSILRDIEQVYQNNARGYVNNTLVDLLLGLLADESSLLDTFLILHSGFIAAVYKVIGTDFVAQMIERIVAEFDRHYQNNKNGAGKQTTNLISVIAQLYSFQVVGSNLVFDYIKLFLAELSEINTELLLRIVKISGSQLRQDDPTSLKDIVLLLQKSVAQVGEKNLPVRTKFMIETINNLKNNKMKAGVAASALVSEHTTRMKKHLGSLNNRNLKGTEPLRIGLADVKNTDKKGKWWLVGASWRNDMANEPSQPKDKPASVPESTTSIGGENGDVDLLQLAREQRMNTDIRRAIFVTIMSASDAKDAHMRLMKLNLKKSQELEIPRVIVHCSGCEENYNPYYTLLARKFCTDYKARKCFQFTLWDLFKSLGEKKGDDEASDDEDEERNTDVSLRKLVNLGKLYGTLIAKDGLSITSIKNLSLTHLKPKTKTFIEILLVTVILQSQQKAKGGRDEKGLLEVFINVDNTPQMIPELQFFLKKVVSKTGITANAAEKETVQWGCKSVNGMLLRLLATANLDN